MIAEMRLQFWADLIADIGKGQIAGSHEIAEPLAGVIAESKLPLLLFEQMITARRWDIYRDPFADRAHFERYIDHTSGHLMWLTACALGTDAALEGAVREHAFAAGIANWLLAVPELSARGRQPLLDDSEAGIAALATGALARLDRARSLKAGQAAPALRAGWQARGILKRAVKVPSKVVMGRLQASEFSRRGLLLMKAATGRY